MARFRRPDELDQAPASQIFQVSPGGLLRALEVVGDVGLAEFLARLHLPQGPLLALVVFWVITAR